LTGSVGIALLLRLIVVGSWSEPHLHRLLEELRDEDLHGHESGDGDRKHHSQIGHDEPASQRGAAEHHVSGMNL
jgi:hypothetical protein